MGLLALLALSAGVWIGLIAIVVVVLVVAWFAFRAVYSEHIPALQQVPLFSRLISSQIRSVARLAQRVGYAPNQAIVTAGEPAKGFFLIQEGAAKVMVEGKEPSSLGPGGYFGEIAVLDGGKRSATVVATTAVSLLEIPSGKLLRLIDQDSSIGNSIYAGLAGRLAEGGSSPSGRVSREQLAGLCQRLREAEAADWGPAT